MDSWERYQDQAGVYTKWWGDKLWTMVPAVTVMEQFLTTFKEYPPSQVGGSLSVEAALRTLEKGAGSR